MTRGSGLAAGFATIALLVLLKAAMGQPAAASSPPETLLHLSASSTLQASPDQLVAALLAQATSTSVATAQRRVNAMVADGIKAAQDVAGVEVRTTGYSVYPNDDKRATWIAQQTLELRGTDGPALLDVVGKLQGQGLATSSLDWRLSPALRRKAHNEATTTALRELQTRADAAAAALSLHVDHLRDVRLNASEPQPRQPFPARAMNAAVMAAPQVTAASEDVTAEVSAEVVLRP